MLQNGSVSELDDSAAHGNVEVIELELGSGEAVGGGARGENVALVVAVDDVDVHCRLIDALDDA